MVCRGQLLSWAVLGTAILTAVFHGNKHSGARGDKPYWAGHWVPWQPYYWSARVIFTDSLSTLSPWQQVATPPISVGGVAYVLIGGSQVV